MNMPLGYRLKVCSVVYVYVCMCTQVLVLGNKVDLPNALRERDLIERM